LLSIPTSVEQIKKSFFDPINFNKTKSSKAYSKVKYLPFSTFLSAIAANKIQMLRYRYKIINTIHNAIFKVLRGIFKQKHFCCIKIQVSRKWRTTGALRCRRDYRKREKNVKKILLNLFANLAVFESGT
jgi:hypothetical protein